MSIITLNHPLTLGDVMETAMFVGKPGLLIDVKTHSYFIFIAPKLLFKLKKLVVQPYVISHNGRAL